MAIYPILPGLDAGESRPYPSAENCPSPSADAAAPKPSSSQSEEPQDDLIDFGESHAPAPGDQSNPVVTVTSSGEVENML